MTLTSNETAQAGPPDERPTSGEMYDYYLGGTVASPASARHAERVAARVPEIRDMASSNRVWLQRVVRWLVAEMGVDQLLDVGAGLPSQFNTYETAQEHSPSCRVVYVDKDPRILDKSTELLREQGATNVEYLIGDLREPDRILEDSRTRKLIDFGKPVGLLLVAVLHFIGDADDPYGLVRRYIDALAPGSYLALSHVTADGQRADRVQAITDLYKGATDQAYFRSKSEVARFFDGLELVPAKEGQEPNLAWINAWRSPTTARPDPVGSGGWCGVARKP